MGVTVQQYRASIGMHNNLRCKQIGNNISTVSILCEFEWLFRLVSAAGLCIKLILRIVWILIFVIKLFQRETTLHPTSPTGSRPEP